MVRLRLDQRHRLPDDQRGVLLRTAVAPGLPAVEGDRIQLLQVIINLALNGVEAVGAMPPARRHVTVAVGPADGGARITVSDAGDGFSPEARGHLFEPFVTSRPGGLGVGLSISRSIVEACGGKLWLDDAPGGARLHVDLPAASVAPPRTGAVPQGGGG